MREAYTVTLDRPDGVTVAEMRDYIRAAVESFGGGLCPEDPLFGDAKCPVFVVRRLPASMLKAQALRACGAELFRYEAGATTDNAAALAEAARRFLRALIKERK